MCLASFPQNFKLDAFHKRSPIQMPLEASWGDSVIKERRLGKEFCTSVMNYSLFIFLETLSPLNPSFVFPLVIKTHQHEIFA